MRSLIVVSALSALLVSAQNFSIDPTEVSATQRAQWCAAQTSTCNTLCDSNPQDNSCAVDTLDVSCTCQNGSAPGLQYYTQTMDTFICQQAFTDCNEANVGNAKGQENCTTSIQDNCGTLDPADYTATPTETGSSSSASGTSGSASSTAEPSSAGASSSSSQAAAPTNIQHLGTGALAAGMGVLAYLL